jgi:hypothetical protein
MKWENEELDEYQERELSNAKKLGEELRSFVDAVRIEKGEMRGDFYVMLTRGKTEYRARRDYRGYINIIAEYSTHDVCPLVSSHARGEVYAKYKLNNMKVPSQKKMTAELDAIDNEKKELEAKQAEAEKKEADFLASLKGFDVKFSYDWSTDWNEKTGEREKTRGKITGGEIVKNGLVFSFELQQDGYISKKISVHYSVDNTLEAFKKLTD